MRRLFMAALLAALPASAAAPAPVTRIDVIAKPAAYIGKCPANLSFIATIRVARWPLVVEYQWERSDGSRTRREHVQIRGASQGVTDLRRIGRRGQRLRVWQRLHVLAPNPLTSRQARAIVTCR